MKNGRGEAKVPELKGYPIKTITMYNPGEYSGLDILKNVLPAESVTIIRISMYRKSSYEINEI